MIKFVTRKLMLKKYWDNHLLKGKTKYFCIGQNKTGTTSLKKSFENLGFIVGDQLCAEELADKYYFDGVYAPIISYCETAQVFQDIPFSLPETFKHLDEAYPNSKFILSIRDNAEQWYQSLTGFHAKAFGEGEIPTLNQLKGVKYVRKGYVYSVIKQLYGAFDGDLYNKGLLTAHYNQ